MIEATKICNECKIERPLRLFLWYARSGDGLDYRCKPCRASRQRESRRRNGTIPDYDGKCSLCRTELPRKDVDVDHDHKTHKKRGHLCRKCNIGLGMFRDDVDLLYKAILYLRGVKENG